MKTKILAIAAVATTLIGGSALLATNAVAQSNHPTVGAAVTAQRHPEIRKALKQLRNAMTTMENAADDFHGHKKDAMDHTKRAIHELEVALKMG